MTEPDPFERAVRAIVEGQLRSFVHDHPSILQGVDWYAPSDDRAATFVGSVSKRILRDLLCPDTRVRLVEALLPREVEEPR